MKIRTVNLNKLKKAYVARYIDSTGPNAKKAIPANSHVMLPDGSTQRVFPRSEIITYEKPGESKYKILSIKERAINFFKTGKILPKMVDR